MKSFSRDHQLLFSSVFSSPKCKDVILKTTDLKVYVTFPQVHCIMDICKFFNVQVTTLDSIVFRYKMDI